VLVALTGVTVTRNTKPRLTALAGGILGAGV